MSTVIEISAVTMTCDECHTATGTFGGPDKEDVWQEIRQAGWRMDMMTFTCICPDCLAGRDPKPNKLYKPE